jgi:hypothetical protein
MAAAARWRKWDNRGVPPVLFRGRRCVVSAFQRVTGSGRCPAVIIGRMSLAQWLSGRNSHGRRLPDRIEELRGPAQGVIVLPRHLSWPGMRECDVTDDSTRRNMYGIVLTQGQRNDVARFLNPQLLRADWPQIRDVLDPKLRDYCERRFALDGSGAAPAGA